MNQNNPSRFPSSYPAWQAAGQVLLPANPGERMEARSRLVEKLDPLQLPEEFVHRIETSVRQILERVDTREPRFDHVRLFIFVPVDYKANRGSWGFFRIERIDSSDAGRFRGHAVDLYLYPDGK